MIRSRSSWLIGLCVSAVLIAGCGSSSSTTTTSSTTSSTAAQSSTPATTSSTPTTSTSSTTSSSTSPSAVPPANVAQAVALCKSQIQAQSTLPAAAKSKLEAVCEKAAKGDKAAVKVAAREICEEVIKKSSVPASAQQQALAACKTK